VTDHEQRRLAALHDVTCRRIAERHGGRIWVDGMPGGGTTVSFALPDA
jgi:signal transduction histidine kinase